MSVSLRKQRDKPSENRIFKKENKYGNLSIIHHSQRLPKRHFSDGLGGGGCKKSPLTCPDLGLQVEPRQCKHY